MATTLLSACGLGAVKASEKELLADRIMAFDDDRQETAADETLTTSREGAGAQRSAAGRGCH